MRRSPTVPLRAILVVAIVLGLGVLGATLAAPAHAAAVLKPAWVDIVKPYPGGPYGAGY